MSRIMSSIFVRLVALTTSRSRLWILLLLAASATGCYRLSMSQKGRTEAATSLLSHGFAAVARSDEAPFIDRVEYAQLLDRERWLIADGDCVWRTVDGGRTWSRVYRSRASGKLGQHIRGLSFIDERAGYLIDEGSLLSTSDGGRSWREVGRVASGGLKFEADSCYFTDEMRGWAVGIIWSTDFVSRPKVPMYVGGILHTRDGGRSWQQQEISLPPGYFEEEGVSWDLVDVCFIDERHGWAVGSGVILWTEDGGEHWHVADSGREDNKQVRFLNEQFGWVTQRQSPELLITTDGGRHWRLLQGPPGYGSWATRAAFLTVEHGFAFVADLYETKDGGQSWTRRRESDRVDESSNRLGTIADNYIGRVKDGTLVSIILYQGGILSLISPDGGGRWIKREWMFSQ